METSQEIDKIYPALIDFQSSLESLSKNKTGQTGNQKYRYLTLDMILAMIRQYLKEFKLAIIQWPINEGDRMTLKTRIIHNSGQFIEFEPFSLPFGGGVKEAGSLITYMRRYIISAFACIAGEDDDDGTMANNGKPNDSKPKESKPKTGNGNGKEASQPQIKKVMATIRKKGMSEEKLQKGLVADYGVKSLKQLTVSQASEVIERLEKLPDVDTETGEIFPLQRKDSSAKIPESVPNDSIIPQNIQNGFAALGLPQEEQTKLLLQFGEDWDGLDAKLNAMEAAKYNGDEYQEPVKEGWSW